MTDPAASRPSGAARLFSVAGIDVYGHWTWLLVAVIVVQIRADAYSSIVWNVVEYLSIFVIVLLHEFGHAFATRSVGGTANKIMLWPLGGVAYVRPPARPGALLWSIFAGPLVNLLLVPVLLGAAIGFAAIAPDASPDLQHAVAAILVINVLLLVFNLLPIYPLDGGQILHALLWFVIGRERGLTVAAGLGLVASVTGGLAAVILLQDFWIGAIAAYAAWRSFVGLAVAKNRSKLLAAPRYPDRSCPHCGELAPQGLKVLCPRRHVFDPVEFEGRCPQCDSVVDEVICMFCTERSPVIRAAPEPQPESNPES